MQQKLDVINKLQAIYGDQFNFETTQMRTNDDKFKTFIDIKARLKLSKDWRESIDKTINLLKTTFPAQEIITKDGEKVTEHPFSIKIVQSDYNTNDKWSINIEIKIGDELDTFGATVFDKAKKETK